MLLDTGHDLLLAKLLALPISPFDSHLISILLLHLLVNEDFESLLAGKLADVASNRLPLLSMLVLVHRFPEPFVDLVLFHVEMLRQHDSILA